MKQSQKVKWIYSLLHVQQSVTNVKCIISQHNYQFFQCIFVAVHKPCDPIWEESFQPWSKPRTHCSHNFINGKSLSMQGFFLVVKTCDNPKQLGPECMGMWEHFKFQLPDCFNSSCCRMQMCTIMEQKTPLDSIPLPLLRSANILL